MKVPGEEALLVLNLGSATIKAAWFARVRDLDTEPASATRRIEIALQDSHAAPRSLLAQITDALGLVDPPAWVGHRIVHGGNAKRARLLDITEVNRLRTLAALAPLHQPPALALVQEVSRRWPQASQCGAFDTAWHGSSPASTRRLPVPKSWDELGVRRYGFHGLAFSSAMRLLCRMDPDAARGKVVLAHLGGGASLCAVQDGQSLDTTMTTTPLDGLPMATRSGSLDPGALLYLLRHKGLTVDSLEQALYHHCGLRGMSGLSGDVRELLAANSIEAKLALEVFALRAAQSIAGMAIRLGGIGHLVFSGGIGANAAGIRSAIVAHLSWLGVGLDSAANIRGASRLQATGCPIKIWRIDVNEEIEIAAACVPIATAPAAAS